MRRKPKVYGNERFKIYDLGIMNRSKIIMRTFPDGIVGTDGPQGGIEE
jgi:hypothetical protein